VAANLSAVLIPALSAFSHSAAPLKASSHGLPPSLGVTFANGEAGCGTALAFACAKAAGDPGPGAPAAAAPAATARGASAQLVWCVFTTSCLPHLSPSGSPAISSRTRRRGHTTSQSQIAGPYRTIVSSRLLYHLARGNLAKRGPTPIGVFPERPLPAAATLSVQCMSVSGKDRALACTPTCLCGRGGCAAVLGPVAPLRDCAQLLPPSAVVDIVLKNMTAVRCSKSRVSDSEMVPLFCVRFVCLGVSSLLCGVLARSVAPSCN